MKYLWMRALTLSCLWYPISFFWQSRRPQTQRHHLTTISHQAAYSTTPYHRI